MSNTTNVRRSFVPAIVAVAWLASPAVASDGVDGPRVPGGARVAPAAADQTLGSALMMAHVGPGGELTGGAGVKSAAREALGRYKVTFERRVVSCGFMTSDSLSSVAAVFSEPSLFTASLYSSDEPDSVRIQAWTHAGVAADRSFQLLVTCMR